MKIAREPILLDDYAQNGEFFWRQWKNGGAVSMSTLLFMASTRSLEPFTVVGGNPAKFIKKRVL